MAKKFSEVKSEIMKIWKGNKFDPNGSYIGNAVDKLKPVQDQDDL